MIVNEANIELAFKGFKTRYTDAFTAAPVFWDRIAMTIQSGSRDETYGWLGQFPQMREWLGGERVVKALEAHGFTIANRKYEATVGIKREDFADDNLGVYAPVISEMGHRARQHPEELIFKLLSQGTTTVCYDGQNFFDTDHPAVDEDGAEILVSNVDLTGDPGSPFWYLMDTSRAIKPMIWQEREAYDFQYLMDRNDTRVFMTDQYLYGVRARVNAGFGLWQLAYASNASLTADNYAKARSALSKMRGDQGRIMGIRPTTLVVPFDLEADGQQIVNATLNTGGGSNPWAGTAELIVTPYLDTV
ncbi:Mu-like prophage major head subunit gpT family protein [Jannaschia rubra]|uniref:Mu-like prophage major head subunit gpT family protein n=1 Tax=Jannaschia rubra TaxID=282197 RepID=UPI00249017B9|nr:Mu-like prophage major head subunit gpT family protein [Jannaschia rubra]